MDMAATISGKIQPGTLLCDYNRKGYAMAKNSVNKLKILFIRKTAGRA